MQRDLSELIGRITAYAGLRDKRVIGLVSDAFGETDWLGGPGDDGAAVAWGPLSPSGIAQGGAEDDAGWVVACGEALLPGFVARDPYGAGIAAVLTNVNDLAAMGARPTGLVNTIVADEVTAREILRGLRYGCDLYDVPLLGGHLTRHGGPPALSAFGLGRAEAVLSSTHVEEGHAVVLAGSLVGEMRPDFPFFAGFRQREAEAPGDIRLLATAAESGAALAAKDVSMAGIVGSLAMLLEPGRWGAEVDLDRIPVPAGVDLERWLTCFPNYLFLLTTPPERVEALRALFHERALTAEVIGSVTGSGELALSWGGRREVAVDLRADTITGLR
ncbi:MAG: AIR synthase related protein [Nocardioides sp.]